MFIAALTAYVTVSLISATVAATAGRRPQLQMLRQIGASRSQVARAMTIEAALVAATGIVLGTLVALATLLPFDNALGAPGLPAGSPLIYLDGHRRRRPAHHRRHAVATRLVSTARRRAAGPSWPDAMTGGAGGIRTHTGRILNPVPLPLGYGPARAGGQTPSSLRSRATCPVALTL